MLSNTHAAIAASFAILATDIYIGWEVAKPGEHELIKLPLLLSSFAVMAKSAAAYAHNQQQRPEAYRRQRSVCETLHANSFTSWQMLGAIVLALLSTVSFVSMTRSVNDANADTPHDSANALRLGVSLLCFAAVSAIAVSAVNKLERRYQVPDPLAENFLAGSQASSESAGSPRLDPQPDLVIDVAAGSLQPM
ncbi:MAG: hypothetical protein P1U63_00610 [Coxiellaceae bacterium]|nr:hypothetical protein [Coxiellaceae bacterium]